MTGKNRRERIRDFVTGLFSNSKSRTGSPRRRSGTQAQENPNAREVRPVESLEDRLLLTYVNPDDIFVDSVTFGDVLGEFEEIGGASASGPNDIAVLGDRRVSGAIQQVVSDPGNPDILYAASVNGGVWKTTNARSASPTWVPTSDSVVDTAGNFVNQGLSIGAISFDYTDSIDSTPFQRLAAGTGLWSTFSENGPNTNESPEGGVAGQVFLTDDGGTTWTKAEDQGNVLAGQNIVDIAIERHEFDLGGGVTEERDVIVVATSEGDGGLFRSDDGGATFTRVTAVTPTGASNVLSLVTDRSAASPDTRIFGRLYAAVQGANAGVYRSDDFGASWTVIDNSSTPLSNALNSTATNAVELAVHPTSGRLYVGILQNSQITGLHWTQDADQNSPGWVQMDTPYAPVNITNITLARNSPTATQTGAQTPPSGQAPATITVPNHGLQNGHQVLIRNSSTNGINGRYTLGAGALTRIDGNRLQINVRMTSNANLGQVMRIVVPEASNPVDEDEPQGQIHFSLETDPSNQNIVYLGLNQLANTNDIGGNVGEASLWRGNAAADRANINIHAHSPQWDTLVGGPAGDDPQGGTAGDTRPHRGSRDIAFVEVSPGNFDLIQVDDGGIFLRTDPTNNSGDWASRTGNLNNFEYVSVAYDTQSNVVIAGAIDNGTQQGAVAPSGTTTFSTVLQGDGSDVSVGTVVDGDSIRYYSNTTYGGNWTGLRFREFNSSGTATTGLTNAALNVTSGPGLARQTYMAIAANALHGEQVILGAANGIYESFDRGANIDRVSGDLQITNVAAGPLAYGGKSSNAYGDNRYVIFGGTQAGDVIVRTQSAGQFQSVNAALAADPGIGDALSGEPILDVEINPTEWTEAYITTSTRVFRIRVSPTDPVNTPPTILSVTDVTRNLTELLDFGAAGLGDDNDSRIFSLEYIEGVGTGVPGLAVGTSTGVYAITIHDLENDASAGAHNGGDRNDAWFQLGTGLPDVQVRDMTYDAVDDVLILATLGRGTWQLKEASTTLTPKVQLSQDVPEIFENPADGTQVAVITATLSRPNFHSDVHVQLGASGSATFTDPAGAAPSGPGGSLLFNDDDYTRQIGGVGGDTIIIPAGTLSATAEFEVKKDTTASTDDDQFDEDDELIQVHVASVNSPEAEIGTPLITASHAAAGLPIPLADADPANTPASTSSVLTVTDTGLITDLDVTLNLSHSQVSNLSATLSKPRLDPTTGTPILDGLGMPEIITVELFPTLRPGANIDNATFDDEASTAIADGLPDFNGSFIPFESLSAFDGQPLEGDWTLTITDSANGNSGTLNSWSITTNRADPAALPQVTIIDDDATPLVRFATPSPEAITEDGSLSNDGSSMTNVSTITVELVNPATGLTTVGGAPYVSGQDVTVTISVDPSSTASAADDDYTLAATTILIPAGQNFATTTITAHEETGLVLDEVDETVVLNIDSVINGVEDTDNDPLTTEDSTATVTIEDRDPEVDVSIAIDQTSITEGGTATVTATLNNVSAKDVVVDFERTGANAEDADFTLAPITITAGMLSATGTLTAVDDNIDEDDTDDTETLNLRITDATLTNADVTTDGTLSDNFSIGIIDNDDAPFLTLSVDNLTIEEDPLSGTRTARVTASLPTGVVSEKTITVNLAIDDANDTAEPADYITGPLSFTIAPGATSGFVDITTQNDQMDEDPETILIDIASLTNAQHNGAQQQTITITDDDALPIITLAVDNTTITEDPTGTPTATITATLNGANPLQVSEKDVTVELTLTPLLTASENDYTTNPANPPLTRTITILAGTSTATMTLTAFDDNIDEPAEDVDIDITNVTNGTEATPQQVTVTITDNEPDPNIVLSVDLFGIRETPTETATVTATLVDGIASEKPITVNLAYNGATTATPGVDFISSSLTIVIPAGSLAASQTVSSIRDSLEEFDERVILDIDSVINGTEVGDQQVTITILEQKPEADEVLGIFEEQGGASVIDGQVMNVTPNRQVTGAIEDVLAHPTDPDILYVGSINGGIWKTENATATNPNWVPQTDDLESLSIGAIEFDIADPSFQSLVAGTGRFSSFGSTGGLQGRVYVTDDGGDTWETPGSIGLSGENISGVARRGDEIVVTSSENGGGIFRSTDRGATFTPVDGADFLSNGTTNFFDLVTDPTTPGRLYAAAEDTGIYRSDDFGLTWAKITGVGGGGSNAALDADITNRLNNNLEMAVHPGTGRLYLGVVLAGQVGGVYYTSDGDTVVPTWVEMDVPLLPVTPATQITGAAGSDIVITAAGHGLQTGDTVIVRNVQGNTNANGFWTVTRINNNTFSLNGSNSGPNAYVNNSGEVVLVTNPSPSFKDIDEAGSQGRIHFSITTDPTDHNIVYIGGDRQEQPNQIGDTLFGGSIFRGDASINRNPNAVPSPQWDHITNNEAFDPGAGTANNTGTHADSRDMTFDAAGNLIEVDDGGIFKRTAPRSNTGDWFSLAGDLGTVEYHSIGYDTISDLIVGGTQDNGTHAQLSPGSRTFRMISGGDGGDVAIDSVTLAGSNQSIRYISSQNLGGFHSRVYDSNGNQVSRTNRSLTETDQSTLQAQFYTPVVLNAVNPTSLILGAANGIYESFNQGDTVDNAGPGIRATGSVAGPLAYGGFSAVNGDNEFVIYAGDSSGVVHVRTLSAGTFLPSPDFGSAIRDVEIDPAEWMTAFAVNSDSVRMTTDAGVSWTDVTGNLFSIGAGSIYSLQYINGVVNGLVIGTDRGAFATTFDATGAPKDWFRFGSGLPDVQIRDMDYDATDDVLILGTLGRGAWRLQDASLFLEPQVIISTDKIVVPEDGSQVVTVTARLSRESDVDVVVDLSSGGTATFTEPGGTNIFPDDYSRLTGQIVIPAGQLIATTTITPLDDAVHEIDEVAQIQVTGVTGAQLYLRQQESTDSLDYVNSTLTAITDSSTTTSSINVPDVGYVTDVSVRLNVNHAQTSDLIIQLTGPDGTTVLLQDGRGTGGNLVNTTFDDSAGTSVSAGDNPFTGLFIPEEAFAAFDGRGAAGTWTLSVEDTTAGNTGTLLDWTLTVDRVLEPTILPEITILDDDPEPLVRMSVVDASVNEDPGAGSDHQTTVTFELFHPVSGAPITSGRPVVVDLMVDATSTATDVDDFSFPAQITIPVGQPSATATFTAVDDVRDEDSENAVININNVTGGMEDGNQSVTIEIVDNDNPPAVTLSIDTMTLNENSGEFATITASLPTGVVSDKDITVTLAIDALSTATLNSDYTTSPLTITILAGQSSGTFTFTEQDDTSDEDPQTIIVDIDNLANAVHDGLQEQTITILDDDPEPLITLSTDNLTITEDTGDVATITASLPTGIVSEKTITVTLAIDPASTASIGTDYVVSPLILSIDPGESSGTVTITEQSDLVDEFNETVIVDIASLTNARHDSLQQQTVTIVDADAEPTIDLHITPAQITEGGGIATVTATLAGGVTSEKPITIDLGFAGIAVNGVDFNASGTSLTIAPGDNGSDDSGSQVTLTPINDNLNEIPETIDVSIVNPMNAVAGTSPVTTTIIDDDAEPTVTIDAAPGKIQEGTTGQFVARLSTVSGRDVTINLVSSGTAIPGVDFTAPLQIVILEGQLSGFTTVTAIQDALSEDEETVFMDIDSTVGAIEVGTQRDVMLIENDDNVPQVLFLADKTTIDEQGETVTFTATLEQPSGRDVVIDFSVSGAATSGGVDFTDPVPAQIVIPGDGTTLSRSITVSSVPDSVDEFDEDFTVTIDNITNAVGASGQRTDTHSNNTSVPITDNNTITSDIDVIGFGTVAGVEVNLNVQHADAEDITAVLIAPDGTRVTLVDQDSDTRNGEFTDTTFADGGADLTGASPFTGTFAPFQPLAAVNGQPVTGTWQLEVTDNSFGSDGTFLGWDLTVTRQLPVFEPQTVTIVDDDALEEVFFLDSPVITEGTDGQITVALSNPVEKDVSFNVVLHADPGAATITDDFTLPVAPPAPIVIPVTIPALDTQATIDITAVEDLLDEFDETIRLDIESADPANGIVGVVNAVERDVDEVGLVTIVDAVDTDDEVNVSITTQHSRLREVADINTPTTTVVTVSLDQASGKPVTVNLDVTAGTAVSGTDFVVGTTTLTILAGTTSATTTLFVINDAFNEDEETVILDISGVTNAKVSSGRAVVAVEDEDPLPIVSIGVDNPFIAENSGAATFTVALDTFAGRDVTVDLAIGGTAAPGTDFVAAPASAQVVIAEGQLNATFTVTGVADGLDESNETVTVDIANVVNGVEDFLNGSASTTIVDGDATPPFVLSVSPDVLLESGTQAQTEAVVTATLTQPSGQDVTIDLGIATATEATPGTDFLLNSTVIFIPAGAVSGEVRIQSLADAVHEADETVVLEVTRVVNTTMPPLPVTVTATISDDDPAPVVSLAVLPANISENGGSAVLTATLSEASEQDVTIDVAPLPTSTATVDVDFTVSGNQIFIPAGETSGELQITAIADDVDEDNETVTFEVRNPVNATIGTGTASTDILDENPTPSLTLSGPLLPVSEDGGVARITATLSGTSSRNIVIDLGFDDSTADITDDYTTTATSITIPAGQLSGHFDITTVADDIDEINEAIVTSITSISGNLASGVGVSNTVLIEDQDDPPSVNLSVDLSQIAEDGGQAIVTAELVSSLGQPATSGLPVTVLLDVDGTALGGGVDFDSLATQLVINPGASSGTFTFSAISDTLHETNETIDVTIGELINGQRGIDSVQIEILDDDSAPTVTLTASETIIPETGTVTLTAELSAVSGQDVIVDLQVDGDATNTVDYTIQGLQIVVPAGAQQGTVLVTAIADGIDEDNEDLVVDIFDVTNGAEDGTQTSTVTITDVDPEPTVTLEIDQSEISENGGVATVTATLSAVSSRPITVNFDVTGSSANAGVDFNGPNSIVISPGSMTGTATITATSDAVDEDDESVVVDFLDAENATENGVQQVTTTIIDATPEPDVQIAVEAGSEEISENGGVANFILTLSAASEKTVTVDLVAGGEATGSGVDFAGPDVSVVFLPGETSKTVSVTAVQDALDESDETVTVAIASASNAQPVGPQNANTAILDDDALPTVEISASETQISETIGNSVISLTLSEVSGRDVTVSLGTDGTVLPVPDDIAESGTDYQVLPLQLTIPAGELSITTVLNPIPDDIDENDETVTVSVSNPDFANVGIVNQETITIADTDDAPTVTLVAAANQIAEDAGIATFSAELDTVSGLDVTVELDLIGDATANTDFNIGGANVSDPLQIVIPAGALSASVDFNIIDDDIDEFNEFLTIAFSSVTNGVENIVQQVSTQIIDNDLPTSVTLSADAATISETGETTTEVTVALANPLQLSGKDITVHLLYSGAADADDVTGTVGSITIPAGQASASVTLAAVDDLLNESDETLVIDIDRVTNAAEDTSAGEQQATVTILDDDLPPAVSLSIDNTDILEDGGTAVVIAILSEPSGRDIDLTFSLSGNAVVPDDATASPLTVQIPAGATSATLTLTAEPDDLDEHNEEIIVAVGAANSAAVFDGATVLTTILDDDDLPVVDLSVSGSPVAEGDSAQVTATLSQVSGRDVTVTIASSGQAELGVDYMLPQTITILAGSMSESVDLTTETDLVDENDEVVDVVITDADWAIVGVTPASVTIEDTTDAPILSASFASSNVDEFGGSIELVVTLDAVSAKPVSVEFTPQGGATTGEDYSAPTFTVDIAPGLDRATLTLDILNDDLVEGDETIEFAFDATSLTNAQGSGIATTEIDDDDTLTLTVTIDEASAIEGSGPVQATVRRNSADNSQPLDVMIESSDDSEATVPTMVTIPANADSARFSITPVNDGQVDGPQDAVITVSEPADNFADGTAPITILDAMVGVNLFVDTNTASENGETEITIRAVTGAPAVNSETVTIAVAAEGGTNLTSDDYTLDSLTITIPQGAMEGTTTFKVINDTVVEAPEQARISIDSVTDGLMEGATDSQVIDIEDNDSAVLTIDDVTIAEGTSGTATTATFTVSLDRAVDAGVDVDFATVDGSAEAADDDFTADSGALNFAGTLNEQQTITVSIGADAKVELDEMLEVVLSNVAAGNRSVSLGKAVGVATITNDDTASISIADVSQSEGDTGTTDFVFTVSLQGEVDTDVAIDAATVEASAVDSDFAAAMSTLTFPGNGGDSQTQSFTVSVSADTTVELNEHFEVMLSNLTAGGRELQTNGVSLANNVATGTIENDDSATLSISDVTLEEGDSGTTLFTFAVTLDQAVDTSISINYATEDSTATVADSDYSQSAGILNFTGAAGEVQTLEVTVNGDETVELDEQFLVNLIAPAFAGRSVTAASMPATGQITNDDIANIGISDAVTAETDSGTTGLTFIVTLDGPIDSPVTVNYQTTGDTATAAAGDYTPVSAGSVVFTANGAASQTREITIDVIGDQKVELDETFFVDITSVESASRNVTITDNQGVGTITNDDSAVISIADVAVAEGDSGDTAVTLTITLSGDVDTGVTVDLSTADGSATTEDSDYTQLSEQVQFAANSGGAQSQTVTVNVSGDEKVELGESFFANIGQLLAAGRDVTIADDQAVVSIGNDDAATVSVADTTVTEGDSGTSTLTFTVTLDGEVDTDVRVNYNTADNTALASDGDYTAITTGNIVFSGNSGTSSQTHTIDVTVAGDTTVERDEIVRLVLNALSAASRGVTLSQDTADGVIINDDDASLSITDATVAEGDSGETTAALTVTLTGQLDTDVSFNYSTVDGTATTADGDFRGVNGAQLTFPANGAATQTRTINIAVNGDEKVELSEAFTVALSNVTSGGRAIDVPDGGLIGSATITNDDSAVVTIADVTRSEGDNGVSNLVFSVVLDSEVSSEVTLDFATSDESALAGSDYNASQGTLTFAGNAGAGPQSQTFAIEVNGDAVVELDESFNVNLTSFNNNGLDVTLSDGQAVGTIANDDGAGLEITNVSRTEGDSGAQDYTFDVTLNAGVAAGVQVQYATADGTATAAGGDYTPVSGTLSFTGTAGQTESVTISVAGDSTVELDESFFLNLTALTNDDSSVTLGQFQVEGQILNDDSAAVTIGDVTLAEGNSGVTNFVFPVTLSQNADVPVTLDFATADGTAVAGEDFTASSGTISFQGTAGTRNVVVAVNADQTVETDESFTVNLSNFDVSGRGITLNTNQVTGNINDDDGVLVSIADATVREGYNGTTLNFVITRSNTSVPVTLQYATSDGTATTSDNDYVAAAGEITLDAGGDTTTSISVNVVGDHRVESDEAFFVNLTTSSFGVTLSDAQATGTIIQDDGYIRGQKFHDLNGDGTQSVGDTALDGFTFQALDEAGNIIASGVSSSVDLNGDGQIDPATEQGQYLIEVNEGSWSVREAVQPGWAQVFPDSGNSLAFDLDQQLNLRFTGNYFQNWGGLNEKWLFSDDGWHFITPAGNLFKWDGSPRAALTGTLVGALGSQLHAAPSLLFDAQPGSTFTANVTAGGTVSQNFGNVATGRIEGRKYHDVDGNGVHSADEPYLNGWTINLHDANGNIIETTVTRSFDRNEDGQIDPVTETGWYLFDRLVPGSYTVTEETQPGWSRTGGSGEFAQAAYDFDQERSLRPAANDFFNWGGRQERWLWGSVGGWHFITPDGAIYEWDGSPRSALTGDLVIQFDRTYWEDISLLHSAQPTADHLINITGQHVDDADFGNTYAHNGSGNGDVQVAVSGNDVTVTGDAFSNTVVVYVSNTGEVMLRGIRDTMVNGDDAPVRLATANNLGTLTIDTVGGHDHVVVMNVNANAINVRSGADNDTVYVENVTAVNTLDLHSASGRGDFRVRNSNVGGLAFWNTGLSSVEGSNVNGGLSASTAGTVFVQNSEVAGAVSVRTGSQADAVIASNSLFRNNVTVDSGSGNDLIALTQAIVQGDLDVNARSGNDTVGASRSSSVNGGSIVRGGAGTDVFASDGTVASLQLTGIESTSNSDLSSLIDEALSDYTDLMLDFEA